MLIEFLNSVRGEAKMYVEDSSPEERRKVSQKIIELLKEGQAVFLIQGNETRRIQGYDDVTNEWLVLSEPHLKPEPLNDLQDIFIPRKRGRPRFDRLTASGSRVTAIGRSAGG